MNFLITGCAGFIGFHLANYICQNYKKSKVIGVDNINNFYSIILKKRRLQILKKKNNFQFYKFNIEDKKKLDNLFKKKKFTTVIHLAAQAGVRDSMRMPNSYFNSNFIGFLNIIELSAKYNVKKFLFASSSSVYGDKKKFPLKENMEISPKNIYSATKKINEEIAKDFSRITQMKIIGLRFFTVYGSYGRPDMFIFKFLKSLFLNKKFYLYNHGNHKRDYTHIDDVLKIIDKLIKKKIRQKIIIFNICSNNPINIKKLMNKIIDYTNLKTNIKKVRRNKIEVLNTHGDNKKILNFTKIKKFKNLYTEINKIIDSYKKEKIWKIT